MTCPYCGKPRGRIGGVRPRCRRALPSGVEAATIGLLTQVPEVVTSGALEPNASTLTFDAELTRLVALGENSGKAPIVIGRRLADRYHVIRLVGVWGMGAVYQAWDETLGLAVALKVILPPRADDSHARGNGPNPKGLLSFRLLPENYSLDLLYYFGGFPP